MNPVAPSDIESPALFASLWQRMPERASNEILRLLDAPGGDDLPRLTGLLQAAPGAQFSRLELLFDRRDLQNLEREKLATIRRFLHEYVRLRKTGYAEAYARLSDIERQLAHAH